MKNQSINRNWYAGKLSATVAIFAFFAMLSGCVLNDSDVAIAPIGNCNDVPGGIEFGMTNAEGVCVALDGSCSVVEGSRGVGERDSRGICVALTGSCSGENGVNVGERDNRGICRALTGSCTGAGISEGERDRTGTCMVLTGSCTGAGISEGERNGQGTCMVLTGSCTGAGISVGERDGQGTCMVLTGSCTGAGISVGERDGTGTCMALTGSCTGAGISVGERDGTGTCMALTGSCTGAGISVGERDGTGTCMVLTGSCTGAGISVGERDGTGTCMALTGSCTGAGISVGERDGTGTCMALTGSCTGAGISVGERDGTGTCMVLTGSCSGENGVEAGERDGTGTCIALTGSCTGAGISVGQRDSITGTCMALTGSCTGAGISVGERDSTGTCMVLTGSCTGAGINAGERDGTGTCVVLTGTCGTGVNAGLRDDTGECIPFSTVTGPTPDDSNPGIVGTLGDIVMNNPLIAALLQTKMFDAATATPQAGGITQSSETGDRIEIADENSITYGEAGDITLAISNSGSGVTWSDISTEDAGIAKSYDADDIGDFKSVKLRKGILGTSSVTVANLYVDVRTDISRPVVVETLRRMGAASLFIELEIGDTIVPRGRYEGSSTVLIEDTQTGPRWSACNDYRPTTQCRDVVEIVGSDGEKRLGVLFIGDNPAVGIEGEASYSGEFSADGMTVNITYAGETGAEATFLPAEREVFPDMDYLVGGNWSYIPETGGNWEIGAFADGSQKLTNDIPLRANAIYDGKAIGLRLDGNELTNFEGDVRLTANFGTNAGGRGQIDGSITGSDLPAALTLNTATYDLTGNNRGIFTDGETSMEGGYTGTWGGQFYGNIVDPSLGASSESSVSGTFGAVKGMPADSDFDVFLGSFGGTEQ